MLLFTSLFAHGAFAQPGGEPGGEGSIALVNGGFETGDFTGWIGGEDGVNDGGRIRVNYLDGSMTLIDSSETSTTIAAAGVYVQHTISENIPSGTRFLQLDMVLRGNAGGSTLPFGDDFEASITYP